MEHFMNLDGCNASNTCRLGLQMCQCLVNHDETFHTLGYSDRGRPHTSRDTDDVLTLINKYKRPRLSKAWNNRAKTARVKGSNDLWALRPAIKDQHHQDSLFGNSFQSKSFFVVHPEWLSEAVDNRDPQPLNRPPWPWEQPRYRQNVRYPITYTQEEQPEQEQEQEQRVEEDLNTCPPRLPYALPKGYAFTHPSIDECRPYEKNTQFGAPIVDTSSYKLGY